MGLSWRHDYSYTCTFGVSKNILISFLLFVFIFVSGRAAKSFISINEKRELAHPKISRDLSDQIVNDLCPTRCPFITHFHRFLSNANI